MGSTATQLKSNTRSRETNSRLTETQHFKQELEALQNKGQWPRTNRILKLNPSLDEEGVLRAGGRASKTTVIGYEERHAIIIPKDSNLAKLIINRYHRASHYVGQYHTQAAIRKAGYWVISGPRQIKNIIKRCVTCKKSRGRTGKQLMGELPRARVDKSPPFSHIGLGGGMDIAGWLILRFLRI